MENNFDEPTQGSFNTNQSILIPIYHLQQTPSEAISMISEAQLELNKLNTNSFLNIDVSNDIAGNTSNKSMFNLNTDNIDWSTSLFRPASRFNMSNRRECKVIFLFFYITEYFLIFKIF